ncbi:hypothetical protein EJ04DRAFT_502327 [Polyplosphaeria fusca]|uniref:DUF1990 domain-containing protein n=1 Tax=Polyplosphaeria fusca TaxID=682080 RepID=A0A9P4QN53_9PLEO|nr:hypothetical protein EJ04DRAFT_502327 [Polyplosphaeria fusca]
MNTIAPPPQIKRLPPTRRALGILLGFAGGLTANVFIGYAGFNFWTRQTRWIPYSPPSSTSPSSSSTGSGSASASGADAFVSAAKDLASAPHKQFNPHSNAPSLMDCCVRTVPLDKLKTTRQDELVTGFCRGVWSGVGFAYQRRYLERKYRGLEGREGMLWGREEMGRDGYPVGREIADHFEVVAHDGDKVIVRCGDSPLVRGTRPSDGLFTMEVKTDEEKGTATFFLKSVFVNTTPEGRDAGPLSWRFHFAHRLYTQLWMETALRKLYK